MSDSVSNADIEDVLSSIRRLVSEEPKSAAARLRDPENAEPDRFVLTPAFRVADEPPTAELHHLDAPGEAEQSQPAEAATSPEDVLHGILDLSAQDQVLPESSGEETAHDHGNSHPEQGGEDPEMRAHSAAESALPPHITEAFQSAQEWSEAPAANDGQAPAETAESEQAADIVAENDLSEPSAQADDAPWAEAEVDPLTAFEPEADHASAIDPEPVFDPEPVAEFEHAIEEDSVAEMLPGGEFDALQDTDSMLDPSVQSIEAAEPVSAQPIGFAGESSLESRIAELEAALANAPQEWEPDGSEDGNSDETRPIGLDAGEDEIAIAEFLPEAASEPEVQPDPQEITTAEVEDDETLSWEDASDDHPLEHDAERAEFAVVDASEIEPVLDDEDEADFDPDPAEALNAWAPDEPEQSTAELAAELAQDEELAEQAHDLSDDEAGEGAEDNASENAFLDVEEGVLDEEGLRELVSDLVRQELQGVLGERITRNVRRLVRREIQRAMTMRDLE